MDRPRFFRGLCVAWSAVFGVLCVLLIVLWVRSYWRWDTYRVTNNSQRTTLGSNFGTLYLVQFRRAYPEPHGWTLDSGDAMRTPTKMQWRIVGDQAVIVVPSSIPVMITGMLAAAPWVRPAKRFRLRTLLISTTLIAVVLGLVAWFEL